VAGGGRGRGRASDAGAAGPAGHARPPRNGHVTGRRLSGTRVERRLGPIVRQRSRVDGTVQRRLERRDGGHHAAGRRTVAAAATASPGERQQVRWVRALPVRTAVAHAAAYAAAVDDVGQLVTRLAVKLFVSIACTEKQNSTHISIDIIIRCTNRLKKLYFVE